MENSDQQNRYLSGKYGMTCWSGWAEEDSPVNPHIGSVGAPVPSRCGCACWMASRWRRRWLRWRARVSSATQSREWWACLARAVNHDGPTTGCDGCPHFSRRLFSRRLFSRRKKLIYSRDCRPCWAKFGPARRPNGDVRINGSLSLFRGRAILRARRRAPHRF